MNELDTVLAQIQQALITAPNMPTAQQRIGHILNSCAHDETLLNGAIAVVRDAFDLPPTEEGRKDS